MVDQKKRWFYTINPHFSGSRKVVDQKKKSEFAEPLFYTFLEKWLQNKWSSGSQQICICYSESLVACSSNFLSDDFETKEKRSL